MARCKKGYGVLTLSKRVELSENVYHGLSTNVETFPNPSIAVEKLRACIDAAIESSEKVDLLKNQLAQAQLVKKTSFECLTSTLNDESSYVDSVSGGDEAIILKSGFESYSYESPQTHDMQKVTNLRCKISDAKGEISLNWDSIKHAKSYEIESTETVENDNSWVNVGLSSKSNFTVKELPSGKAFWFRVCAFGSAGEGPWSSPVSKVVP